MTSPPEDLRSFAPPREDPGGGAPLGARAGWPFLALALGLLGLGLAFWSPVPAGVWHDDGVYMLVGKSLGQGDGLRYTGVPGDLPAVRYPPLYPAVLGLLWAVLGSVGAVTLAAEILNLILVATAGGLLAWALHRGAGVEPWPAVGLAGLAFAAGEIWRTALIPLSEPLFLALAAGAMVAWPGAAAAGRGARSLGPLAVLLAAAVLTRSSGVALVLGFGVAMVLRRGVAPAILATGPAILVAVAWAGWASRQAALIPEGPADILGPYTGWLAGQVLGAPGAFLQGLPAHAQAVAGRVAMLLLPGVSGGWIWLAAVPLGAAAILGGWSLRLRLSPLPWCAAAYLALLLAWPFVDRRLVAPLHPWMVVMAGLGILEGARRASRLPGRVGPLLRRGILAAALVWGGGYLGTTAVRISDGWGVAPYHLRAGRLAAAVETLQKTAPPSAVVGAPEFWAALHLHGGWKVAPSARFTPRSEDGETPAWGTPIQQLELWRTMGVDHVLLEQGGSIHGGALDLLEGTCPGAVTVLARMPPQILVRVALDEGCARRLGIEE